MMSSSTARSSALAPVTGEADRQPCRVQAGAAAATCWPARRLWPSRVAGEPEGSLRPRCRCPRRSSPARRSYRCATRAPGLGCCRIADHQVPIAVHGPPRGLSSAAPVAGPPSPENPLCRCRPRCRCPRPSSPARRSCPRFRDHPDPVVGTVGDRPGSRAIHRTSGPGATARRGGRAAVTGVADRCRSGHRVDVPGGHRLPVEAAGALRDHPDPGVAGVGDHQVPGGVHRHRLGIPPVRHWWPGRPRRRILGCRFRPPCRCAGPASTGRRTSPVLAGTTRIRWLSTSAISRLP